MNAGSFGRSGWRARTGAAGRRDEWLGDTASPCAPGVRICSFDMSDRIVPDFAVEQLPSQAG